MLTVQPEISKTFEIVVAVRNSKGEDTGKRRSYTSDSAYKIWEFYSKTVGNIPSKKHQIAQLPTETEAKKILQEMYGAS